MRGAFYLTHFSPNLMMALRQATSMRCSQAIATWQVISILLFLLSQQPVSSTANGQCIIFVDFDVQLN